MIEDFFSLWFRNCELHCHPNYFYKSLFDFRNREIVQANWALVVAGSNTYDNYRHQADVLHAYNILTTKGGIPASNVVLMMYVSYCFVHVFAQIPSYSLITKYAFNLPAQVR